MNRRSPRQIPVHIFEYHWKITVVVSCEPHSVAEKKEKEKEEEEQHQQETAGQEQGREDPEVKGFRA